MYADEIRKSESGESEKGNESAYWLREIAAQLAELNEHLREGTTVNIGSGGPGSVG